MVERAVGGAIGGAIAFAALNDPTPRGADRTIALIGSAAGVGAAWGGGIGARRRVDLPVRTLAPRHPLTEDGDESEQASRTWLRSVHYSWSVGFLAPLLRSASDRRHLHCLPGPHSFGFFVLTLVSGAIIGVIGWRLPGKLAPTSRCWSSARSRRFLARGFLYTTLQRTRLNAPLYLTASPNEVIGSTSTGTLPVLLKAAFRSAGILSYFANHASARARSPVASISSSSFASARDRVRHLREIDRVAPARVSRDRALLDEVVELHHLRAAVRLGRRRSARCGRCRRRTRRSSRSTRDPSAARRCSISHSSAEHADDVGLRLFEAAVHRADRLANVDLLAVAAREWPGPRP